MFVPTTPTQPSPRAQDLGEKLVHLVREYLTGNPETSHGEVSTAFRLALERVRAERREGPAHLPIIVAGIVTLVIAGVGLAFFLAAGGSGASPQAFVAVMVAVVAISFVITAAVVKSNSSINRQRVIATLLGLLALGAGVLLFIYRAASHGPVG
jgi:hypothetical protein